MTDMKVKPNDISQVFKKNVTVNAKNEEEDQENESFYSTRETSDEVAFTDFNTCNSNSTHHTIYLKNHIPTENINNTQISDETNLTLEQKHRYCGTYLLGKSCCHYYYCRKHYSCYCFCGCYKSKYKDGEPNGDDESSFKNYQKTTTLIKKCILRNCNMTTSNLVHKNLFFYYQFQEEKHFIKTVENPFYYQNIDDCSFSDNLTSTGNAVYDNTNSEPACPEKSLDNKNHLKLKKWIPWKVHGFINFFKNSRGTVLLCFMLFTFLFLILVPLIKLAMRIKKN
ncbi:uncharacterized protein SCDLUD_001902 [Saccharomycodes ludwigii]|uniref:uncharacterized protein n=1 Tax=Saccharomycodes ludwigii TaxID=36035 RepID=UPI001E88A0E1|nr:hypothetical protein SCDLUD_001902 [Saccharomycodes ludwigii]KAH3902089.1 hypothetical protein SCDLUD_001902 [Saccharomycodes ludwigii]